MTTEFTLIPASGSIFAMKLCRFQHSDGVTRIGAVVNPATVLDLTAAGLTNLASLLEAGDPLAGLQQLVKASPPSVALSDIQLLALVKRQEVWAAGVTYLRSKAARMEESNFSASAYDRVYAAARPELFFKSLPEKVVGPGGQVGIRRDATWNVPEPELALVLNSHGKIVGHTIGSDVSSRDIEGENLLYLPQAKTDHRSCALGPWIVLGTPETQAREWAVRMDIHRAGENVFAGGPRWDKSSGVLRSWLAICFAASAFPMGRCC
jgi:2-dehydro-3-deoxy-D-arabinonate dehydratase